MLRLEESLTAECKSNETEDRFHCAWYPRNRRFLSSAGEAPSYKARASPQEPCASLLPRIQSASSLVCHLLGSLSSSRSV
jgi:hypothetical protein